MEKMKLTKKVKIGIAGCLCVAVLGVGSVYAAHTVAKNNAIGEEAAKGFAFLDAGVSEEDVVFADVEFEFKNGTYAYDVDFVTEKAKYEYLIQSSNGDVLKKEIEVKKVKTMENVTEDTLTEAAAETANAAGKTTEAANASKEETTEETTKNQAEESTKIEETTKQAEETSTKENRQQEQIKENTTKGFQGETAVAQETQKEKATTKSGKKKIKEYETETTSFISVDKAKRIALNDAGVAELSSVKFDKAKLERDDGAFIYEIEFYVGTVEYEYEIDAVNGSIVERSIENKHHSDSHHDDDDDYDDDYDD